MSVIRSTSNPEGLYIYYSCDGVVVLNGSEWVWPCIPETIFEKAIGKFYTTYDGAIKYKGFKIDEVCVFEGTTKIIPYGHFKKCGLNLNFDCSHEFRIRWRWKGKSFFMWRVTFDYVANDVMRRLK